MTFPRTERKALIATWQENEERREREGAGKLQFDVSRISKNGAEEILPSRVLGLQQGPQESWLFHDLPCLLPIRYKYNLRMAASLSC